MKKIKVNKPVLFVEDWNPGIPEPFWMIVSVGYVASWRSVAGSRDTRAGTRPLAPTK